MKKTIGLVVTLVLVVAILGGYLYVVKNSKSDVQTSELTEVQKLNNKNLDVNYPETPREVVKLYNRIITAYYVGDYSSKEFDKLTDQALTLMDDELKEQNPKEVYVANLTAEISEYQEAKKTISRASVCDSNAVKYIKDNGDELAYVTASYFIKVGSSYESTDEMYVLRKDENGNWKILLYYQIAPSESEDD